MSIACALALSAARLVLKTFKPAYLGGFHPDSADSFKGYQRETHVKTAA
jgi:hypothetical protein